MGCGAVIVALPCPSVNGSCFGEDNVRDIDKSCCEVGSQVWCGSCDDLCSWGTMLLWMGGSVLELHTAL